MSSSFPREPELPFDLGRIVPSQLSRRIKWGAVVVGLIVAYLLLSYLRSVYTDWLWYGQLGLRSVFVKVLVTRLTLFVAGTVLFAIPAAASLYIAHRLSQGPEQIPVPQAIRDILKKLIAWGAVLAVIVSSLAFGAVAAGQWELFLRFSNAADFGITEPVFGQDVAFYVFSLPLYEFVQTWLLWASVATLLITLGLYFVNFSFRGVGFQFTPALRVQISIILAVIMVVIGAGHWLDRWGLLLSTDGTVFGAAYTDIHARKPALMILTFFALAASILILVNAYMRGVRLLVGGVALWAIMAVLLGALWPNAIQRFTVEPQEFTKEQEYIARNIEFTRRAFGLHGVFDRPYPAQPALTADLINANLETVENIRLWDKGPLSNVYKQLQIIRPYYDFHDADVDRYTVGGELRQVMLAAREIAHEKLQPEAQTWINTKLRYTHGFGIAMSPVTEFTPEGRPEFFAKDIPNDGVIAIGSGSSGDGALTLISNPRIYYGEKTTDYVIVNTDTDELDYEAGDEIKSTKYFGKGGVPIGSFLNRIAYAWHTADYRILISDEITGESKIQYRRTIQERISTVAPFLRLDGDPYIVAVDDKLQWIQDAYTHTDRYPYSDPNSFGFNYIRNSVKVVVDAFDGSLTLYVADPTDPLILTYQKIFPKLFTPLSEMSEALRAHIRYPQDLFGFQSGKYLKYHMLDAQDFYNLSDIWAIPDEKFGQSGDLQSLDPYYAIMKIPGEDQAEFVLLIPFTRNDPPIMAGWLAARNDGENYGELVSFTFPKDRQLDSPRQIEVKIDNDITISPELTLLCQEGSDCIRGNLLVLPMVVEDKATGETKFSILYAEPIYLQAEGVEFPELKKVILASQERVVMRDSIPEAIKALTGVTLSTPAAPTDGESPATGDTVSADPLRAGVEDISKTIEELKDTLSKLEEALDRLKALAGEQ